MTTSTATVATSPRTYDTDARSARIKNIEIRDQQNLPPVKVIGNTFPVKSVLWALGGNWSKEHNCFLMPAHTAQEAQSVIDGYAAAHPKVSKPKAEKPQPVKATVATPVSKPTPVAAIKGTATVATMCKRLANLGEITDTLVTDLLQAGMVDTAASVVKALAIFNQEHSALLK